MKLKLGIHAKDISVYINFAFYFDRIRTLVAMSTYISRKLIIVKVKTDKFFCLIRDIWNLVLQKCLLSKLHMAFGQIAEFDWLPG